MANVLRLHRRRIRSAIAIALGTLCSAGSPCCTDESRVVEKHLGNVPLREARGGALVDAAPDAPLVITQEQCLASCADVPGGRDPGLTCRPAAEQAREERRVDCVNVGMESVCSQPAGRRHARVRSRARPSSARGVAEHLAEIAELEAVSVHAFALLARDLRHHRAPRSLVKAAERAMFDEVRHARSISVFAQARGASVRSVARPTWHARSLPCVAKENLIEGCVREAFGALLAAHQAAFATDASLRELMRRIAIDEARHAALATAIHEWATARLTSRQLIRLEAARRRAWNEVAQTRFDPAIANELGLPTGETTTLLAGALQRSLALASG